MSERLPRIGQDTFVLMPKRRTFSRGVADILDATPLVRRLVESESEQKADSRAIASDWRAVGRDLEIAYVWGRQKSGR
jgi:hypothetical protein